MSYRTMHRLLIALAVAAVLGALIVGIGMAASDDQSCVDRGTCAEPNLP